MHSGSMPREALAAVGGLTCAAFIFNSSEFMPIGLLTDIASSFSISEATCGIMISVYAWAVMLLSLPLMLAACRVPPRRLILGVAALFGTGQLCSSVAPTFALLVGARLIVACAHAVFWSVATPFAVRVAGEPHGPAAIGTVAAGSCVAMVFGMPLGRMVGLAVGWRMTFALMAALAALVMALLARAFPKLEAGEAFSLSQLPSLARNRALVGIYLLTALVATGYYTGYSYIEPFLGQVVGMGSSLVTLALMAFGAAGLLGSQLFSRLYERRRGLFLSLTVVGIPVALLLMLPLSGSAACMFVVCLLWGVSSTAFNVACQAEVIRTTSQEAGAVAMSIFSGIFNLGIGCGSFIGGHVVDALGVGLVGVAGGAIALAGLAWCAVGLLPQLRANVPTRS
uniref:MFS transporter n=1 Tax=Parolsenella massiliensis TaxID=1871022 RepID=UPI0009326D6F|nr:MFS transporter [Parolsenella massiliensis]